MKTRVVRIADLAQVDLDRWRDLAERAIDANVYLDPRWLVPSVRLRPEAADLRVAIVEDDAAMHGLLAFTIEPTWRGFPFRAISTEGAFLGTHAERHHPLVDAEDPVGVLRAMLRAVTTLGPRFIALHKLPGDGALAAAFDEAASREGFAVREQLRQQWAWAESLPSADPPADALPLPVKADHPLSSASAKVRRRARALAREVGDSLELEDRRRAPEAGADFIDFQASGWKGDQTRGGLALKLDPVGAAWFLEIVQAFQRDGDLRAITLKAAADPLYMALNLRSGSGIFGFLDAYDDRFARLSVGALGRSVGLAYHRASEHARFFDPDVDPVYATSTELYPDRRDRVNLLLARGVAARILLSAVPAARRARAAVTRVVRRTPAETPNAPQA